MKRSRFTEEQIIGGIKVRLNSRVDGEVRCFLKSLLDERQDLGPELSHPGEDFAGGRTAKAEIDAADTHVAQCPDVGGDDCRRTGEQAVFAVAGLRRYV